MSVPVYDASALLAVIFDEPGADVVMDYLATPGGEVSAVNWAEVVAKLVERGLTEAEAVSELSPLGLDIVSLDAKQANAAGGLRKVTRNLGLSLGDRCCLALVHLRDSCAITADRDWMELKGFDVRPIR